MARSSKTQQDKPHSTAKNTAQNGPDTPSPEQIAQHFMQVWQEQWQGFLQNAPAMAAQWQKNSAEPLKGFGFPGSFGQHSDHGASPEPTTGKSTPSTDDALALATAALAASEQCLELLKQCSQWMDGINQRITALEQYAVPPAAKRSAAHAANPFGEPATKPKR